MAPDRRPFLEAGVSNIHLRSSARQLASLLLWCRPRARGAARREQRDDFSGRRHGRFQPPTLASNAENRNHFRWPPPGTASPPSSDVCTRSHFLTSAILGRGIV